MSEKNLYDASYQWANRPDDERFESLDSMLNATRAYAQNAVATTVPVGALRVEADAGDIKLVGKQNIPAKLTHYSFGQLASLIGAPAKYLRTLPATLATQNLNHGLKARGEADGSAATDSGDKLQLLFHKNGSLVTRAITGECYDRVWNHELVSRIITDLVPEGWRAPPARPARENQKGTRVATAADILPNQGDFGLAIKEGDLIAPAGLYASDHDMFAFLVNMGSVVEDGGKLLNQGLFLQNSEVGDCGLKLKKFIMDHVCGNHIVWGVSEVNEINIRHVKGTEVKQGESLRKFVAKWSMLLTSETSADKIQSDIRKARAFEIAATKDEVLDALFKFAKGHGLDRLSRKTLSAGYDLAEKSPRYGAPTTVWGMVNGLTELSQTTGYTDDRTAMDVQAGRLMEIAF